MKKTHALELERRLNDFLGDCDEDGGNPEWCYNNLARDMAKAAAAVYDACMAGQKFYRRESA